MTPSGDRWKPTGTTTVAWRTSTRSGGGGTNCVELGPLRDSSARIAVRDSKDRDGGTLVVGAEQWEGFLGEVKRGAFDLG